MILGNKYLKIANCGLFFILLFIVCCSKKSSLHAKQPNIISQTNDTIQLNSSDHPNVLFLIVDDLAAVLGSHGIYNNKIVQTPNMDRLASKGVFFRREYGVVPTCGASRYAMLTGYLPRSMPALSNQACVTFISDAYPTKEPLTFIANLKLHGYYTVGIGKISHSPDGYVYPYNAPKSNDLELPNSWDEMLFNHGQWGTGWRAFFGYANGINRIDKHRNVKPFQNANVNDEGLPDGLTAELAVKTLRRLTKKKKNQPFFLAVGFFKPHLPWVSPKKYWKLYDESKIPLTHSPNIPENVNKASLTNSGEFNGYHLGEEHPDLENPVSDAYARKLKHAYFAAASYSDAQVGKVLHEMKKLGLEKNTIVILWSDHGWQLGDHRVWGKHTLFEKDLRSVLIIKTPEMKKGKQSYKIVSSLDIYPTLMQLCHIPMPHPTDGFSLVNLLHHPNTSKWNHVAYSYFKRGVSVRTKRYRLTKYFRKAKPTVELYDEKKDPYENVNIAATHPKIVKRLMKILKKGNTGLYMNRGTL